MNRDLEKLKTKHESKLEKLRLKNEYVANVRRELNQVHEVYQVPKVGVSRSHKMVFIL